MSDPAVPLSPLQQSLVAVASGVADLERQRSADLLTIDELTQQTIELKARVDAYQDEIHILRAQADVDRKSLAEAGALIDQLRREVVELGRAKPPAWQPIETAPKDGTEILLCRAVDADGKRIEGPDWGIFIQVASWWTDDWVVYCSLPSEPRLHFDPTHWMTLPVAPEVEPAVVTPPPPPPDKPAASVPNIRVELSGELVSRSVIDLPQQAGERWGQERRWVWAPWPNNPFRIVIDLHDSGQVRVTFDRADWRTPVSPTPLTLDVTVDIDGKRRHQGEVRVHHHTRPTMVFDRRAESGVPGRLLESGSGSGFLGSFLPRYDINRKEWVPETDLAAIAAGKWPWESWRTQMAKISISAAVPNYDPISEEYGQVLRDWSGGAGALLNEAAMLMPVQVAYLLSRDPRAWAETVRLADSSGNYAVHYRLPDGRYPLAHETADLPQLNTDPPLTLTTAAGLRLPVPDVAHQHSLAYLAYLLTGERHYYEELQAWSTYCLLTRPKGPDRLRGLLFSGELRATAWAIRALLHLVLATNPNTNEGNEAAFRVAYSDQLRYNLRWMSDQFAKPGAPGYRPTGLVTLSPWRQMAMLQFVRAEPKPQWAATWQHHVLAYVLGECVRAGFEEAVPARDHLLKVAEGCWKYSPSKYLAAWGNHAVLTEPAIEISGWIMNMERTFAGMPAADPHRTSFADPITPDYIGWYRASVVTAVDAGQAWAREALVWIDRAVTESRWKSVPLVWKVQPMKGESA